jgi:hypothetical protein
VDRKNDAIVRPRFHSARRCTCFRAHFSVTSWSAVRTLQKIGSADIFRGQGFKKAASMGEYFPNALSLGPGALPNSVAGRRWVLNFDTTRGSIPISRDGSAHSA